VPRLTVAEATTRDVKNTGCTCRGAPLVEPVAAVSAITSSPLLGFSSFFPAVPDAHPSRCFFFLRERDHAARLDSRRAFRTRVSKRLDQLCHVISVAATVDPDHKGPKCAFCYRLTLSWAPRNCVLRLDDFYADLTPEPATRRAW